jgi:response regulator RpfG family c-di-GMP phosphodiesterase
MEMPEESGFALIHHVKREHPETAILMVSAFDDHTVADQALERGAFGYVIKPFRSSELLVTVENALRRRRLELESRVGHDLLENAVLGRTAELRASRDETIRRLARLPEFRDDAPGRNVDRMSRYCALIAEALGLSPDRCQLLHIASPLHDVGTVAIPDRILLKRGPLTPHERREMERHPEVGYEILAGSGQTLLELAALVAWTHHERFDGHGYPRGLEGSAIPVEGRIVAVGDVFDALTSTRVYRARLEMPEALELVKAGRGTQFDPDVVDAFVSRWDEVVGIHADLRDARSSVGTPPDHPS